MEEIERKYKKSSFDKRINGKKLKKTDYISLAITGFV